MLRLFFSFSILTLSIFSVLGSAKSKDLSKSISTYEQPRLEKESHEMNVSYVVPTVTPAPETKQSQTKDGVTITCEIAPYTAEKTYTERTRTLCKDKNRPNIDFFEVYNEPTVTVEPDFIQFKLVIRSQMDRIIKLNEVPIIMLVDGKDYSLGEDSKIEWQGGVVMKGYERPFTITGPKLSGLQDGKIISIQVLDVPTKTDPAGVVTKRDNFEWYFVLGQEEKQEKITIPHKLEQRAVASEQCQACSGSGSNYGTCPKCNGTGQIKETAFGVETGKLIGCDRCKGVGKANISCSNCSGKGAIYHPQSHEPKMTSNVNWSGWQVEMVTNPPGLEVGVIIPEKRVYEFAPVTKPGGGKKLLFNYYNTDGNTTYTMKVKYNNKIYEFYPLLANGKRSKKVTLNFTADEPSIIGGSFKD